MSHENIRIIIVEDDADLRESIAEYLTISGYQVTGVGSGRAFYRALDEAAYQVAIIDLGLPDQPGMVLVEYLHANTDMGIIILTASDSEASQLQGYQTGADLYLTKPIASSVLESAIARLVKRLNLQQTAIQQNQLTPGGWQLHRDKWLLVSPQGVEVPLTSLEFRFLAKLAGTSDLQASRQELLQEFYSDADEYTGRALDALVRRLRTKLSNRQDAVAPIKTVYGTGYCFAEQLVLK